MATKIPPVVMREYNLPVLRLWVPDLTTPLQTNFSVVSISRDWMFLNSAKTLLCYDHGDHRDESPPVQ